MNLIKKITDKDIGIKNIKTKNNKFDLKERVEAVLLNDKNQLSLIYVARYGFHQLPGGHLEKNESLINGLKREVLEETGFTIDSINELGKIEVYAQQASLKQISHCYLAKVICKIQETNYTAGELRDKFELKWVAAKEAVSILENDKPETYVGKHIRLRGLICLKKAQRVTNNFKI